MAIALCSLYADYRNDDPNYGFCVFGVITGGKRVYLCPYGKDYSLRYGR